MINESFSYSSSISLQNQFLGSHDKTKPGFNNFFEYEYSSYSDYSFDTLNKWLQEVYQNIRSKNIIINEEDKEFLNISSDQALKELQDLFGLEKPPRRIEGYDISHQSGKNTVGSMVVFINGTAARSEYRKFKIRTSTNDDLKSMKEMIERRLKHKEWDFPDLITEDHRPVHPAADRTRQVRDDLQGGEPDHIDEDEDHQVRC